MNTVIIPYGHYYYCIWPLFQNMARGILFTHLLNKHITMIRAGEMPIITIQGKTIGYLTGMNRKIIPSHLEALKSMGVISLTEKSCAVNVDYFIGVATLYTQQKTLALKEEVGKAFRNHDLTKLSALGLDTSSNGNQILLSMKGSLPINDNSWADLPTVSKSTHDEYKYPQWVDKDTVSKSTHKDQLFKAISDNFHSKSEYIYSLCVNMPTENAKIYAQQLGDYVFDGKELEGAAVDKVVYGLLGEILSSSWVDLLTSVGRYGHESGKKWVDMDTVNKYINKQENKQANEVSLLYKGENKEEDFEEGQKDYLGVFGKVNSDLISQSQSEKDEEEDNEDSSRYQKTSERNERREVFRKSLNPYRDKPYFQPSTMLDIASDPTLCTESCYRLFLYNFWFEVYNQVVDEKEQDNNDDNETPSFNSEEFLLDDLDGEIISDDVLKECIRTASNYTIENINDGHIENNNGTVEVNCEVSDINFNHIFDWKKATTSDGANGRVISFSNIRNIEADDVVEQKPSPDIKQSKRERNRQDREYCQALRETDNSQLTEMEQAMKSFMETFIMFGERGNIEWCLDSQGNRICENCVPGEETPRKVIPWHQLQPWIHKTLRELGIVPEHFYALFNTHPNFKEGMELDLRRINNVFSYQKAMEWHKKQGFESRIEITTPSE